MAKTVSQTGNGTIIEYETANFKFIDDVDYNIYFTYRNSETLKGLKTSFLFDHYSDRT